MDNAWLGAKSSSKLETKDYSIFETKPLAAHADGSEYRARLEETAERQHSGEERRDDYYRELVESDYASTIAGK